MNNEFFTQRVTLANEVTDASSRGNSGTMYANQGVFYGGELAGPAKKTMVFLSAVEEVIVPQGNGQYHARFLSILDDADVVTFDAGERVTDSLVNYPGNFEEGIWITPAPVSKAMKIGYVADHRNVDAIDSRQAERLSYVFADQVDKFVETGLRGATEMTDTVRGATVLFGGKKTKSEDLLASDTITVSLINEADTRLSDQNAFYWNSGVFTPATVRKNPWENSQEDPFVLIIGKEQIKAFRESEQFISAEKYGNSDVLLNGEIGRLFGIRVVVSKNIAVKKKATVGFDGTTNATVDTAMCYLLKGRTAYVFAWGKQPEFETLKVPGVLARELRVWGMYNGSVLHADAIVKMIVTTNIAVA